VIVSSAAYGHSGGNIPSVMLGSPRDATGNMIMIGPGASAGRPCASRTWQTSFDAFLEDDRAGRR
jgi:hypothetical protein